MRPYRTWSISAPEQATLDWLGTMYGDPLDHLSSMLRGALVSAPGHRLMAGDFSAIEARTTFYLAGDETALNAFPSRG